MSNSANKINQTRRWNSRFTAAASGVKRYQCRDYRRYTLQFHHHSTQRRHLYTQHHIHAFSHTLYFTGYNPPWSYHVFKLYIHRCISSNYLLIHTPVTDETLTPRYETLTPRHETLTPRYEMLTPRHWTLTPRHGTLTPRYETSPRTDSWNDISTKYWLILCHLFCNEDKLLQYQDIIW